MWYLSVKNSIKILLSIFVAFLKKYGFKAAKITGNANIEPWFKQQNEIGKYAELLPITAIFIKKFT